MSLQKFKKRKHFAALIFAGAMALVPFAVSSCSVNCNPQTQTDKSDNSDSSDVNNNSSSTGSSSTPDTNTSKDEHSKIVYNLLHDEYYVNLKHKLVEKGQYITKDMLPVPYKFLRDEGKNVDAYLNGTLNAFASSYMYENDKNNLYVSVKAENKSTSSYGNYYTNYVLKYPLTDQESEEFLYLCDGGYLQGLLFVQELDIQKDPEVLSEVNVEKTTYETIIRLATDSPKINVDKYQTVNVDILKATLDDLSLDIRSPALTTYSAVKKRNLNIALVDQYAIPKKYDNNVYWYSEPTAGDISFDDYLSSTKNIISFGYSQRIMDSNPYHAFDIQK